ncbi:MAG: VCBS repeat-containing protein [Planctomycetes bacterium]|nr:VCBS repeat-containing protein [Planctomycetota bacterium]MCC7170065.1 VCBS repeat-containing protein [Planctomycetota bacterium]
MARRPRWLVPSACVISGAWAATGSATPPRPRIEIGSIAVERHVGDFDRDGFPDIAVRDSATSSLRILRNDGAGSFTELALDPNLIALGSGTSTLGDFDGDGRLDLGVFSDQGSTDFRFARSRGDGSFDVPLIVPLAATVEQFAVADFDRDGADDLAMVMSGKFAVSMKLAGIVVGFVKPAQFVSGITAADFDGDGRIDLAVQHAYVGTEYWPGDGQGHFGPSLSGVQSLPPMSSDGWLGDIDGDGQREWIVPSTPLSTFLVKRFDASWNPVVVATLSSSVPIPSWVVLRDLSGDGRDDVVVSSGYGEIAWFESTGGGSFSTERIVRVGQLSASDSTRFDCMDINGDAIPDVISRVQGRTVVGVRAADGGFGGVAMPESPAYIWSPANTAVADVDGDGDPDALGTTAKGFVGQHLVTSTNAGDGTFTLGPGSPLNAWTYDFARVHIDDFDGDGSVDALLEHDMGAIRVVMGTGTGSFSTPIELLPSDEPTFGVSIVDVDLDGDPDVIASRHQRLLAFANGGAGAFAAMAPTPTNVDWSVASEALAVADVDGDGVADALTGEAPSSAVGSGIAVRHGRGDFTFAAPTYEALDVDPIHTLAHGDLDADGDDDVVASRFPSTEPTVQVLRNDAAAGLVEVQSEPLEVASSSMSRLILVDLDVDGRADVVLAAGLSCSAFHGHGDTRIDSARLFSLLNLLGVVADLDGDAVPELLGSGGFTTQFEPTACVATSVQYGVGCAGTASAVPQLTASGCASSGASLTLRVAVAHPATTAMLVFASASAPLPVAGCSLLVGGPSWVVVPIALTAQGGATFSGELSAVVPTLAGAMTTYAQAFIVGTGAMTNGVMIPAQP